MWLTYIALGATQSAVPYTWNVETIVELFHCIHSFQFACFIGIFMQVTLATIGTYVQVHRNDPNNRLTAERTFVALSLFNLLQFPLVLLPYIISKIIDVGSLL